MDLTRFIDKQNSVKLFSDWPQRRVFTTNIDLKMAGRKRIGTDDVSNEKEEVMKIID